MKYNKSSTYLKQRKAKKLAHVRYKKNKKIYSPKVEENSEQKLMIYRTKSKREKSQVCSKSFIFKNVQIRLKLYFLFK